MGEEHRQGGMKDFTDRDEGKREWGWRSGEKRGE